MLNALTQPDSWVNQRLHVIEHLWNHAVILLFLAAFVSYVIEYDGVCPLVSFHETLLERAATLPQKQADIEIERGVAYDMPRGALLTIGVIFLALGLCMLIFGYKMQRTVSAVVLVGGLALVTEEVTSRMLLVGPASERMGITLTFTRGAAEVNELFLDVACTGSIFFIFLGIWAGLALVALEGFKRAALFFEGAACAVLFVRLAADFYPPLLESHPIAGGVGHFFLGYPLVPFWAAAVPLSFFIGAFDPTVHVQVAITTFLGAFAAAKGLRTIQDYLTGDSTLELAGGDDVEANPVQGATQLGLFFFGIVWHQRMWLRGEHGSSSPSTSCWCSWCGCCHCCSCLPCCEPPAPARATYTQQQRYGGRSKDIV